MNKRQRRSAARMNHSTQIELNALINWLGFSLVAIIDYSNYQAGSCCNGGNYWFSEVAEPIITKRGIFWKVSKDTSSEFTYCNECGRFISDSEVWNHEDCCPGPDLWTTEELLKQIEWAKAHSEDYEVRLG